MRQNIFITLLIFVSLGVSAQNIGIGTLMPGTKLQVGDLFSAPDSVYITVASGGGNTSRSGIKLNHYTNAYGFTIESDDRTTSQGLNIRRHANSIAGVSAIFIDISGNVGISTTSPAAKLEVAGDVRVNGKISNVTDPLAAQDAATKHYVDQMAEILLDAGLNGVVIDIDSNVYKTIKIGTQVWMAQNLRTTHYNDGTLIPKVTDNAAWGALTTPAYCWYDNDSTLNAKIFGALYNYYTVADTNSLNVCPAGWQVPSDAEWTVLADFLSANGFGFGGSGLDIGKSLASTFRWTSSGTEGNVGNEQGTNNSCGFAGLPGGYRNSATTFTNIGNLGFWWSSTENSATNAWTRSLNHNLVFLLRNNDPKRFGFSVRCLRD